MLRPCATNGKWSFVESGAMALRNGWRSLPFDVVVSDNAHARHERSRKLLGK